MDIGVEQCQRHQPKKKVTGEGGSDLQCRMRHRCRGDIEERQRPVCYNVSIFHSYYKFLFVGLSLYNNDLKHTSRAHKYSKTP